jgi:hypothetical protein
MPSKHCDHARVYRTDGSERVYRAECTEVTDKGARLQIAGARFSVGEVVELHFSHDRDGERRRARVIYRTTDEYGLTFLHAAPHRLPSASFAMGENTAHSAVQT